MNIDNSLNNKSAHKNIFQTSDFICYSLMILGVILEYLFPSSFGINKIILLIIGIIILFIAWTILILAKLQFKKYQQKSSPNNETTKIINTGIFKYSRNPIYLGVILISPAIGLMINSLWVLIIDIFIIWLVYKILILPEERYLSNKFGKEYVDYCNKTRRWI